MNLDLLKETFANFIRARGMDRHFHRLGVDMFRGPRLSRAAGTLRPFVIFRVSLTSRAASAN